MRTIAGGMLAATLLLGGTAFAADELMQGTVTVIKTGKLAKFVAKPTSASPLPVSASGGGSLQIFDTGTAGNEDTYNLPASGWSRIPSNTNKPVKGFKYKGRGTSSDPCKVVIVKAKSVKAVCKGSGIQLTTPFSGQVGIILTLGPDQKRFCAVFGGSGKNNPPPKGLIRKGASAPSACPAPFRPTTTTVTPATTSTTRTSTTTSTTVGGGSTSTSSTTTTSAPVGSSTSTSAPEGSTTSTSTPEGSTTSTSAPEGSTTSTSTPEGSTTSTSAPEGSTTSTSTPEGSTTSSSAPEGSTTSTSAPEGSTTTTSLPGGLCCNGASFVSFLTANQSGDCGDLHDQTGNLVRNITCAGLFTGGGGNTVPLPFAVPDLGHAVSAITECTGQAAILGGTNSSETGSNRNCTTTDCLFGAPLAVPNPGSTPTSVCVLNAATASLSGTANCETGATTVDLPLASVIFLIGDILPAVNGIQPCPLCTGTAGSETCQGGPANGNACDPGTTAINAAYPTSHDCPPPANLNIGTLPISFSLTSGSVRWNGTVATNDAVSTAAVQQRIFSGFCRDVVAPGSTGGFEDPPQKCWENGMAFGEPCGTGGDTFETCEQRNGGAFGPNGGANRTITVVGSASSLLDTGTGPATLVGIFSIPPTFDPTVDGAGDLPGPGAVALPGTATLCTTANPCGQ